MKVLAHNVLAIAMLLFICVLTLWGCDGCNDSGSRIGPDPVDKWSSNDSYPAVSPDGSQIAYYHADHVEDPEYPTGLYMVDSLGQNSRLLIGGFASVPDWSPSGDRIVFSNGDLFTMSTAGDSIRQLTNFGHSFFPSWSPDGSKLVFDTNYNDPRGANAIWIINANGTGLHDISVHGTGEWREPDWSPDGQKIVHIRYIDERDSELFVMDADGDNWQRLTFNEFNDSFPDWSPDGTMIAWSGDRSIWLMDTNGLNQRRLTEGASPAWSPDSGKIYFKWASPNDDKGVLYSIKIDGTERTQITF